MRQYIYACLFLLVGMGSGYYAHDRIQHNVESELVALNIESTSPNIIYLECLNNKVINKIKKNNAMDEIFSSCNREIRSILAQDFGPIGDDALRAILSTIIAANFADYGNSSAITFEDIANSDFLNCGNTILLAGYLYGSKERSLRSIGFDGGKIGNHAQLYYNNGTQLLLDPTIGLIAKTSFDDLLRGVPVPKDQIRVFSIKAKNIDLFRQKVYLAVLLGQYHPSDFMYMHETLQDHLQKATSDNYFTPGGIYFRETIRKQAELNGGNKIVCDPMCRSKEVPTLIKNDSEK